jgi:cell division protein FtsA
VLSEDEKELGVCLIDIGGGTTDIAVYANGAIRHTAVIPIAGDQITNDIAMALRTPTKEAEDIKIQHAVALVSMADPGQMIEVPGVGERGPRQMSRATLAEVVEPRGRTVPAGTAGTAPQRLRGLLSSGIVLTGGASLMPGMVELAKKCSTCRCAWACPSMLAAWPRREDPHFRPVSACCCTARTRSRPIADPKWKARAWASCLAA